MGLFPDRYNLVLFYGESDGAPTSTISSYINRDRDQVPLLVVQRKIYIKGKYVNYSVTTSVAHHDPGFNYRNNEFRKQTSRLVLIWVVSAELSLWW